jgi:hypothetical protein
MLALRTGLPRPAFGQFAANFRNSSELVQFVEKVIGPKFRASLAQPRLIMIGKHNDHDGGVSFPHSLEEVQSGSAGQFDVQNQHIRRDSLQQSQAGRHIFRLADSRHPFDLAQAGRDMCAHQNRVFHQDDVKIAGGCFAVRPGPNFIVIFHAGKICRSIQSAYWARGWNWCEPEQRFHVSLGLTDWVTAVLTLRQPELSAASFLLLFKQGRGMKRPCPES